MLFQRLYNWIKYKTLPPSTLFKNRLFIERDNKNRRIVSNFGTTFKNSKWTSYSNSTIKILFKRAFVRFCTYIFIFFLTFLFLYFFQDNQVCFYFYNVIYIFFWHGVDTLDYHISYIFWGFVGALSTFLNTTYSFFFFNNLSSDTNSKSKKTFLEKFIATRVPKSRPVLNFDKIDSNWTLFSFLDNTTTRLNKLLEHRLIENLFDTTLNISKWNNTFDFYLDLFKTTYFFKSVSLGKNALFSNYYFQKIWECVSSPAPATAQYTMWMPVWEYFFKFTSEKGGKFINFFLTKLNKTRASFSKKTYNPQHVEKQSLKNNFLILNKHGSFNFWDLKHDKLSHFLTDNSGIVFLQNCFNEQIKIMKTDRWLYRYSTLNRKILKNSHKLSISKKILNNNLSSLNDFKKNLWVSANSNNLYKSNPLVFTAINDFLYNPLEFTKNIITKVNNTISNNLLTPASTNIENLKLHETSYFWFLKRMYTLNSLTSQEVSLQKKINIKNLNPITTFLFNKKLLKNHFFFKNTKIFLENNETSLFDNTWELNKNKFSKNNTDIYLNYFDFNFYNKETTALFSYFFTQFNYNQNTMINFLLVIPYKNKNSSIYCNLARSANILNSKILMNHLTIKTNATPLRIINFDYLIYLKKK